MSTAEMVNFVDQYNEVESKIIKLRNHNVILDADVAVLYGQGSRYLVIDFSHPWLKSTRQRAKLRAATVLRPLTFALNEQSVYLPQ